MDHEGHVTPRLARRRKGWTQSDLAQRLGVSVNTVSNWEKGAEPRARMFRRLCDELGVRPEELAIGAEGGTNNGRVA